MIRKRMLFFGLTILAIVLVMFLVTCLGVAKPAPGVSFSGMINMGDKASSATIGFKISEDGTSIKDLKTTVNELKLDGLTAGQVYDFNGVLLTPIEGGRFNASIPAVGGSVKDYKLDKSPSEFETVAALDNIGKIEGKFLSVTKASGTIKIYIWLLLTDYAIEVGEFTWEAESTNQ